MANKIYPKWKEAALQSSGSTSLAGSGTTGLYAVLVDTGVYIYSDAHQFYNSISGIIGSEVELASKTFTDGVLDCADFVVPSVSGNSAEAIVLFVKNAGANTTWRLFAFLDTGWTGLPVTPDGNNIAIAVHASGIVAL